MTEHFKEKQITTTYLDKMKSTLARLYRRWYINRLLKRSTREWREQEKIGHKKLSPARKRFIDEICSKAYRESREQKISKY